MGEQWSVSDPDILQNQLQELDLEEEVDAQKLGSDLLQKCRILLSEVETFSQFLDDRKRHNEVELRRFKNDIKNELKFIEKLNIPDPEAPKRLHTLRSSNLSFYLAVWNIAKTLSGVIALGKRFYWDPRLGSNQILKNSITEDGKNPLPREKIHSCAVDIVSQDGAEWVKISSITEKRIFFDLARAGWVRDSSSEEDEFGDEDDDEPDGILKQAEALFKASKATRVRYRHPTIRFLLPRVTRGTTKEVDQILQKIEALGIKVETAEDMKEAPPIAAAIKNMDIDPFILLSSTLNIDCTILLAFVSDLSHGSVAPEEWHHRAIRRQIEMEKDDQLLPNSLWPACGPRPLVCTKQAITRMHEIVDLIGTESEKKRRDYLVAVNKTASWSREQRIRGFQELSAYDVPKDWNLPIVVIEFDPDVDHICLPANAPEVMESHSPINKSVFLYGWAAELSTISSNRQVAKDIETTFETTRVKDEDKGPHIWLCPTARSLVGKEKNKRNWDK